jgi:hypothetical protein
MSLLNQTFWTALERHCESVSENLSILIDRLDTKSFDSDDVVQILEQRGFAQWLLDFGLDENNQHLEKSLSKCTGDSPWNALKHVLQSDFLAIETRCAERIQDLHEDIQHEVSPDLALHKRGALAALLYAWEDLTALPKTLQSLLDETDLSLLSLLARQNIPPDEIESLRVEWGISTTHKGQGSFINRVIEHLGSSAGRHPLSPCEPNTRAGILAQELEKDEIRELDVRVENAQIPPFMYSAQPSMRHDKPRRDLLTELFSPIQASLDTLFHHFSSKPLSASGQGALGFLEIYQLGFESHIALVKRDDDLSVQIAIHGTSRLFDEPLLFLSPKDKIQGHKKAEGIYWFPLGSAKDIGRLHCVLEVPLDSCFQYFTVPKSDGA